MVVGLRFAITKIAGIAPAILSVSGTVVRVAKERATVTGTVLEITERVVSAAGTKGPAREGTASLKMTIVLGLNRMPAAA